MVRDDGSVEDSGFDDYPSPIAYEVCGAFKPSTKPPGGKDVPSNGRLIMPGQVSGTWFDEIPSPARFCFYVKDYWAVCRVCEEKYIGKCMSIENVLDHLDSKSHKRRWLWQDEMRKDAEEKANQHNEWCHRNKRETKPPFTERVEQQLAPPQHGAEMHIATAPLFGQANGHSVARPVVTCEYPFVFVSIFCSIV